MKKDNYGDEEVKEEYNKDLKGMERRKLRIKQKSEIYKNAFRENNYSARVNRFQKTFEDLMKELLHILTKGKRYETHIANLATRLDYNGYYSELFADDINVIIYPK